MNALFPMPSNSLSPCLFLRLPQASALAQASYRTDGLVSSGPCNHAAASSLGDDLHSLVSFGGGGGGGGGSSRSPEHHTNGPKILRKRQGIVYNRERRHL